MPQAHHDRGWRFSKWVDAEGGGRINCDPWDHVGTHADPECRFQIFENLVVDLHFDDVQGPQDTSISSGPSGVTNGTSAVFGFTSSDPDAAYECRLDRPGTPGTWFTCGSPFDRGESFSGLTANGSYTFSVRGRDPSGNLDETPVSRTWTVDTVGPTTSIGSGPAAGSRTKLTAASFALNASEPGSFQCKLDRPGSPGTFATCGAAPGYSGLIDGEHTFTARAVDGAGNVGPAVSRSWTVDTVAPDSSIGAGPAGSTSSTGASFGFSATGGATGFECKLDAGAWEPCTSGKSYSGLAHGEHTFSVRAVDAAGNVEDSPAARTWTVDLIPPDTSIDSGPSGETRSSSAAFAFSSPESGMAFQCRLDSGPWEPCASGKTYSSLAAGAHTFHVRAVDAAGNVDATEASRTWTISAPPVAETGGGGTDGGTGGGGTAGTSPEPGGAPAQVSARLSASWAVRGRLTRARRIALTGVTPTASVRATCRGRGCPFRSLTLEPTRGTVNLTRIFRRRALKAGTWLELRVTAPGMTGKVVRLRFRARKRPSGSWRALG